ncbi:cytochrome b/b6 domain-containing protein [Isoptericola sp. b490]|uniref:cytochrome b/b6 domain-containing protein n=1 Tax=Actinotalea lenta TaxID=3064654 RepID=UPI002713B665|nr:cytochrome b/b6 domain-containing protein [Isoptericola sp. b490]MDO8120229.1 cytochrome b/b6 domain-containing protein [Isoptericola sp. b490]
MSTAPTTRRFSGLSARARWVVGAIAAVTVLVALVVLARWAWGLAGVQDFVARYPGVATGAARTGTPAWVDILHFFNLFLMALMIKSGLMIHRTRRPAAHWTRRGRALLARSRTRPATITLEQWFHVSLDLTWLVVGTTFVVLLFTSGRWVRLVPTSWDVVPNALSVVLQYLSLHWPQESTWVAYNALQMLTYFVTVFVLAPISAATGLRLSELWPKQAAINRYYPIERARAVHFPTMWLFAAFIVVHVAMVMATGAVANLNHMFGARPGDSLVGVLVFTASAVVVAGAWLAARPVLLRPLAALTGKVTR